MLQGEFRYTTVFRFKGVSRNMRDYWRNQQYIPGWYFLTSSQIVTDCNRTTAKDVLNPEVLQLGKDDYLCSQQSVP